jgi:hypothetical protein
MRSLAFRFFVISFVVIGLLSIGILVYATNVNRARHPNLAAAQDSIETAIERLSDAQRANAYHMKGHAADAKALLVKAYNEVKLAEEAVDRRY